MMGGWRSPGRYLGWAVLVLLVLFPLAAGPLVSDFYVSLLIRIFVFGIVLLGFDILVGYCGLPSFGHAMFFGSGAYVTGILLKHVSTTIWLSMGASVLACGLMGLVIGYLCIRSRGLYFIFLTFAFAQFFYLFFNSWPFVGAADGMPGIPKATLGFGFDLADRNLYYYFALLVMLAAYWVARRIAGSALGRALVGIRENEERAEFLGYNVHRCMLIAFVISAVYGGLGGCLFTGYQSFVSPAVYHWALSGEILVMELIGGMGTLIGPLIGSASVIYLGDILSTWMPETWLMVLGAVYVTFILFFSEGIMGLARKATMIRIVRHAVGDKEAQ